MLCDDAVDGGLKIDDRVEDAVLSCRRASLAKTPSRALSQEQDVTRCGMVPSRMSCAYSHASLSRLGQASSEGPAGRVEAWIYFFLIDRQQ